MMIRKIQKKRIRLIQVEMNLRQFRITWKVYDVPDRLIKQNVVLQAGWNVGERKPHKGRIARLRFFEPRAAEQAAQRIPYVMCWFCFIIILLFCQQLDKLQKLTNTHFSFSSVQYFYLS